MISENQVGEILSQRHRNESISHIARTMNLSRLGWGAKSGLVKPVR